VTFAPVKAVLIVEALVDWLSRPWSSKPI